MATTHDITLVVAADGAEWGEFLTKSLTSFSRVSHKTFFLDNDYYGIHPDLESACYQSHAVVLLVTYNLLYELGRNAALFAPIMDGTNNATYAILLLDQSEFIINSQRGYEYDTENWITVDPGASIESVNQVLAQILDSVEQSQTSRRFSMGIPDGKETALARKSTPKEKASEQEASVHLFPPTVDNSDEKVVLVFEQTVEGDICVCFGDPEVRVDAHRLNSTAFTFTVPPLAAASYRLRLETNGVPLQVKSDNLTLQVRCPDQTNFVGPAYLASLMGVSDVGQLDLKLRDAFVASLPDTDMLHGLLSHAQDIAHDQEETSEKLYPTFFHWAAHHGLCEFACTLLTVPGAMRNLALCNRQNLDPIGLAREAGHDDLADYLADFKELQAAKDLCDDYMAVYTPLGHAEDDGEDYVPMGQTGHHAPEDDYDEVYTPTTPAAPPTPCRISAQRDPASALPKPPHHSRPPAPLPATSDSPDDLYLTMEHLNQQTGNPTPTPRKRFPSTHPRSQSLDIPEDDYLPMTPMDTVIHKADNLTPRQRSKAPALPPRSKSADVPDEEYLKMEKPTKVMQNTTPSQQYRPEANFPKAKARTNSVLPAAPSPAQSDPRNQKAVTLPRMAPPSLLHHQSPVHGTGTNMTRELHGSLSRGMPLARGALGSHSQSELVDVHEMVKRGHIDQDEATLFLSAWCLRFSDRPSASFKERRKNLDELRSEYAAVRSNKGRRPSGGVLSALGLRKRNQKASIKPTITSPIVTKADMVTGDGQDNVYGETRAYADLVHNRGGRTGNLSNRSSGSTRDSSSSTGSRDSAISVSNDVTGSETDEVQRRPGLGRGKSDSSPSERPLSLGYLYLQKEAAKHDSNATCAPPLPPRRKRTDQWEVAGPRPTSGPSSISPSSRPPSGPPQPTSFGPPSKPADGPPRPSSFTFSSKPPSGPPQYNSYDPLSRPPSGPPQPYSLVPPSRPPSGPPKPSSLGPSSRPTAGPPRPSSLTSTSRPPGPPQSSSNNPPSRSTTGPSQPSSLGPPSRPSAGRPQPKSLTLPRRPISSSSSPPISPTSPSVDPLPPLPPLPTSPPPPRTQEVQRPGAPRPPPLN